ncbi:MAG: efflux RND transporter permease subunit, partial [Planctomycetota bacterium]
LDELQRGLPPGVEIHTAYDRSALIERSIETLRRQLIEEMLIVALVCIIFLWHARSALVAAVTLPLGILLSFAAMNAIGVNANIMSLGGIAVAIGAMVDAAVVLVENAHKRLDENPGKNRWEVVTQACQEVGPALFFSLLIITVSFLPVFSLKEQAGRLFKPLAYTKTFAMGASSILAITIIPVAIAFFVSRSALPEAWSRRRRWTTSLLIALVPPLLLNGLAPFLGDSRLVENRRLLSAGWLLFAAILLLRQRIRSEQENPVTRLLMWIYMPVIRGVLRHPVAVIVAAVLIVTATIIPYSRVGSEFMPPLNEGDILYMPTSIPGISITEAQRTLQIQDQLFKSFPEVEIVLGKIGRAETSTDPAPLTMVETTVTLRQPEEWPERKIVEGQIRHVLLPGLRSYGDLGVAYLRQAADETEKMALAELNPRIRREYLGGRPLAEIARAIPEDIIENLLENAPGAYVGQVRQSLMDEARSRLEEALAARPLGEIGHGHAEVGLAIDLEPVSALLRELWPGSEGFLPRLDERLQKAWGKEENPELFLAELTDRATTIMLDSLPEHLLEIGLIEVPVRASAVRRHLSERLRGDALRPLKLRRVRDIEELMYDEMDPEFQFPGLTNAWTMPIKTRIDMLATGIKTPIGIKIFGPDLITLERLAIEVENVVKRDEGTLSAIAERVFGGNYLDFDIDRQACARHGLTVGDVQDVIETAIGGMNVSQTVEGLYRFKINVRYPREMRDDPVRLARVLVPTPRGEQIPIGQLAAIEIRDGPPAIKSEDAMKEAIVYVDLSKGQDVGSYVERMSRVVKREVRLPAGYYITWSGQFEYMQEVNRRLKVIVPVTLLIVFLLLYFNFGRMTETLIVMFSLPFAVVGGIWYMYLLDYNMSVAVGVGFIALAGLAAETGVVMLVYLDLAWDRCLKEGRVTLASLREAIIDGAVLRVRPKMMTVATTILALVPIMWATGAGARPMKRLAAPMIGGLVSSTILTLVVIPAVYYLARRVQHGLRAAEDAPIVVLDEEDTSEHRE